MLQSLREKLSGWVAVLIVGALAVPFAFFGVNNYFVTQVETYVAKVGEREIDQDAFRSRFEQYRQQQRQALGVRFDARALEDPTVKREVLERMIDEELLAQAAERAGMVVTDQALREAIAAIPAFQVDGHFDPGQYQLLLQAQGLSSEGFQHDVRRDLTLRGLPTQIVASAFVTGAELDDFIRLADQTRDIEYLALEPPGGDDITEPEQDVADWYQAHGDRYLMPETVGIDYVELRAEDVQVPSSVDEESLRERYEEQRSRFVEPEQRRAAHILLTVPEGADAAQVESGRAEAAGLAERARQGEDFAALARENSEDVGSKAAGGELGWIEQGLLDPAFESALYALPDGGISEPVRSGQGWHVIKLLEVRPGSERSFEQVRAELERQYLEGERERAFSDLAGRLVDQTYKDSSSLAAAAEAVGLKVESVPPFGRDGGPGVASRPEVLREAFKPELIADGQIGDPIELGANHILLLQVTSHQPAAPRPLEEVRAQVEADLRAERLAERAKARAEELLARVEQGESFGTIAQAAGVAVQTAAGVRREAGTPDRAIVTKAFELAASKGDDAPAAVGAAELSQARWVLVRVTQVTDGDPAALDPNIRKALRQQLASAAGDAELRAYLSALRTVIPVTVSEDRM